MPDAPKWTVTEWADDCHPEEARWFVHRDNAWYSLVVGARTWSGFADLAELQEAHPRLRPVDVDNVAALLADFHDLDAELAKTVSNFEEFAEAAAEQRKLLTAERDEARAALERERTENAQWSFEAGRQTGEFIRDAQEQIAALAGERDQARRDAASWEDWGRGWKTQAEANQAERDKAWADLDAARRHSERLSGELASVRPDGGP